MLVCKESSRIGEYKSRGTIRNGAGMVKLESVKEVLFQALLLDDVKFEDGKVYAELCTVYLLVE
jgi:hypothetical protein